MIDYAKSVGSITAPLVAVTAVECLVGGMSRHIGKTAAALVGLGAATMTAVQFCKIAKQRVSLVCKQEQETGQLKPFQKIATVSALALGVTVGVLTCIYVAFPEPPKKPSGDCWEWRLTCSTKGMTGPCNGQEILDRVERHPDLPLMVGYNYFSLPKKVTGTGTAQVTSLASEIFQQCSSLSYKEEKTCLRDLFEKYRESNGEMRDLQAVLKTIRGCVVPGVDYHRAIMGGLVLPQNLKVVGAVPAVDSFACTPENVRKISRAIAALPDGVHVLRFFRPCLQYSPEGAVDTRSTLLYSHGALTAYYDPGKSAEIAGWGSRRLDVAYQLAHRIVEQMARTDGKVMQLRIYPVVPMVPSPVVE
jgi:hypothetical protein